MHAGQGEILEIYLDPLKACRIGCPRELIPGPGQYLMADVIGSDSPLPAPVFFSGSSTAGFIAAAPLPESWKLGAKLQLRGPLGRGFSLPDPARHVALVAFDGAPARLLALLNPAFEQNAEVVLLDDHPPEALPVRVEAQPLAAIREICDWADYMAVDVRRVLLADLQKSFQALGRVSPRPVIQILVETPLTCGGLAKCGVCIVEVRGASHLACEQGPVFDFQDLF